ncbi:transcription factor HHO3-like [Zingiber officinale]|uniref:transcription factor HHO3-like n=1 Tax=Zingiber officinale TaxID=94328 RepID=UPI001C4CB1CA|nr:transcription factor HHO3-like [Zingiber officinale]
MDMNDRIRVHELIRALHEERKKVEAFQSELPLCLQLIDQSIETYKQMMDSGGEGRSSYNTVVEEMELISLNPNPPNCDNALPERPIAVRARPGGALSVIGYDDNNDDAGDEENLQRSQSRRKVRRYWSEDLHKRFLHALEQLGGCDVATPKYIRKLMKVDGLTNDEIKSHLQKFRLHSRRSNPAGLCSSSSPQSAQFVVVRGIWIPTPADVAASSNTPPVTAGAPEAMMQPLLLTLPSPFMFLDQSHGPTKEIK